MRRYGIATTDQDDRVAGQNDPGRETCPAGRSPTARRSRSAAWWWTPECTCRLPRCSSTSPVGPSTVSPTCSPSASSSSAPSTAALTFAGSREPAGRRSDETTPGSEPSVSASGAVTYAEPQSPSQISGLRVPRVQSNDGDEQCQRQPRRRDDGGAAPARHPAYAPVCHMGQTIETPCSRAPRAHHHSRPAGGTRDFRRHR